MEAEERQKSRTSQPSKIEMDSDEEEEVEEHITILEEEQE